MAPGLTMSNPVIQHRLVVRDMSDAAVAMAQARDIAIRTGLNARQSEEVALVAGEMATNLVKHAGGGTLSLDNMPRDHRRGIFLESSDSGPGIRKMADAMTDGFSTTRSLGYGLGTINRLMDEFSIQPKHDRQPGLLITCSKWLRDTGSIKEKLWDIGTVTRPMPGAKQNGDAVLIKTWDAMSLVGVIDGLGHGRFAHRASLSARQYIEDHYDEPLSSLFQRTGYACRATRGVVMALALINWEAMTLSFGSIGNIETLVKGDGEPFRFIFRRGIIGKNAPQPVITEHLWTASRILIMHSDGLQSHWDWEDFSHLQDKPAQEIATALHTRLARFTDDSTVVVVKGIPDESR